LIIGSNEGAKICIHTETDEIHFIEDHLSEGSRIVNSDLTKFFAFFKMYLCCEIVKVAEEEGEEPTEVIKKISNQFCEMDSRALADEDHYWALILEQAEYGLYY
jgi:hypothetical protein